MYIRIFNTYIHKYIHISIYNVDLPMLPYVQVNMYIYTYMYIHAKVCTHILMYIYS